MTAAPPATRGEHLISRPAYTTNCTHCRALILIAIEGGSDISADPHPIGIHAEIAEIIGGNPTWEIVTTPGMRKSYLLLREECRIAAAHGNPVVRRHRCPDGIPRTTPWKIPPKITAPKKPKPAADNAKPPF